MSWIWTIFLTILTAFIINRLYQKYTECSQALSTFLSKQPKGATLLLLIAHPDDESMFFLPLIESLKSYFKINILCFSNGNADGLGKIREKELKDVAKFLQIQNLTIIENGYLRDGMKEKWDVSLISKIIDEHYRDNKADIFVTFDNYGVSSHPNHIAVSNGVK